MMPMGKRTLKGKKRMQKGKPTGYGKQKEKEKEKQKVKGKKKPTDYGKQKVKKTRKANTAHEFQLWL